MAATPNSPKPDQKRRFDFQTFANHAANLVGSRWSFLAAALVIIIWGITGPIFHYSDTWQLIINTGTTIITFLMVFLIQNTQYRDARAIHLKLDEIIRSIRHAHNEMIDIEKLSDEELAELAKKYESIRSEYEDRKSHKVA
jgi:low affinity Fe/Cu permease